MILTWQLGFSKEQHAAPERWIPAQVPGAVQLDWARAEAWPPYWLGENSLQYRWMEDVWWSYRSRFVAPRAEEGGEVRFVAEGVDYHFEVLLNGARVHEQEGMYRGFHVDLTQEAGKEVELLIRIRPVPKSNEEADDRHQASQAFKPPVSYSWDFHPRLIPLGLWREARVDVLPAQRIQSAETHYELSADLAEASLDLAIRSTSNPGSRLRWSLIKPDGGAEILLAETAASRESSLRATLSNPELWWPHDHGAQPLYTQAIRLLETPPRLRKLDAATPPLSRGAGRLFWPHRFARTPGGAQPVDSRRRAARHLRGGQTPEAALLDGTRLVFQ
jgi:beta-mannosidase